MNLGPTELIIILVIVLVLFGSTRLPKLARSMGQASKEFKKGIAEGGIEWWCPGPDGAFQQPCRFGRQLRRLVLVTPAVPAPQPPSRTR